MAVSAILNVGQCSTFDLDDIEGRVIPLYKGFPGWGVHFWSICLDTGLKSRSNQRSKVKFDVKPGTNHLYRPIICEPFYSKLYILLPRFHFQEPLNSRKSTGTTGQSMLSKTAWWQALPRSLIHWLCSDR